MKNNGTIYVHATICYYIFKKKNTYILYISPNFFFQFEYV